MKPLESKNKPVTNRPFRFDCILIVDDDKTSSYISESLLLKLDLSKNVKVARNGREALNYIVAIDYMNESGFDNNGKSGPELIFLDINMPDMNGWEFLEAFENLKLINRKKTQIVILTTSENPADLEQARKFGITHYITKPLTQEKINDLLGRF